MFQGNVCHIVGDIQAPCITQYEKEKTQSKFSTDSKLQPSTLHQKKIADIENRSVAGRNRSGASRSVYHHKIPCHTIRLSPLNKSTRIIKRVYIH